MVYLSRHSVQRKTDLCISCIFHCSVTVEVVCNEDKDFNDHMISYFVKNLTKNRRDRSENSVNCMTVVPDSTSFITTLVAVDLISDLLNLRIKVVCTNDGFICLLVTLLFVRHISTLEDVGTLVFCVAVLLINVLFSHG